MLWIRKHIGSAVRRRRGQVALETLFVMIPWLIIITLFFNMLFLLSSLMLNQATVNRGALQVSALSCLPDNLKAELASRGTGLGMTNISVQAITPTPAYLESRAGTSKYDWNRNDFFNADGDLVNNTSVERNVPNCAPSAETGSAPDTVPSGNFIYLQAKYDQVLFLLVPAALFGAPDSISMHRGALVVSHALEGEN